jgi:CDP-paratose 2-epimerase
MAYDPSGTRPDSTHALSMKILITGGCGFLGSNLAASYLNEGADVVIVDALLRVGGESNLTWLRDIANRAGKLTFHRGDIAVAEIVEKVFRQHAPFDYVCHVAGQVAMTTSLEDPRRDLLTNVVGTFNVLEAVRQFSPEALVAYSSTNKVYGDLERFLYRETATRIEPMDFPAGFDEDLPLDFSTPYGCSKGAADQYVRDWARIYGLRTVVFRHSSIYGGRQFATKDQGWIGWFCQKAVEHRQAEEEGREPPSFTIAGSGKQVRDVLHAEDLVCLYRVAFAKRAQLRGEIFNIGGGLLNSLSLLELFALLERILKLREPLRFIRQARRRSDQDFFVADITKAESLLAWSPGVSAEAGICAAAEWASRILK